jgi:hypothetical protein
MCTWLVSTSTFMLVALASFVNGVGMPSFSSNVARMLADIAEVLLLLMLLMLLLPS